MSQNEKKPEEAKIEVNINIERPEVDKPSLKKSLQDKERILKNNEIVKK